MMESKKMYKPFCIDNAQGPILLIEKTIVNALAFKRAIEKKLLKNELIYCKSYEEAMPHLEDETKKPAVMIIGLSFTERHMLHLLEHIAHNTELSNVEIIILSDLPQNDLPEGIIKKAQVRHYERPVDYFELGDLIGKGLDRSLAN